MRTDMAHQRIARLMRHIGGHALLLVGACLAVGAAHASTQDTQRAAFRVAYAAAQQGGDSWRPLAGGLTGYPLYPYLEAASLEHDLKQLDRAPVEAYIARYPDLIPAADLRRDYLGELARRQDWANYLALYRPGLGDALACNALQAKLAQGQPLNFDTDLADLWQKPSLPGACDPVLSAAHDQGLLTSERLWSRIQIAADAGKNATITMLAPWLSDSDALAAQRIAGALTDPSGSVVAAANWPDTPRHRQAVTLALQRLARRQSATADEAWTRLQHRFTLSEEQRDTVLNALALFHATDFDENALDRLVSLPANAQTDATREWRVRVALARQDWKATLAAIDALSETQKQDGEWRYFRARAMGKLGHEADAQAQLQGLAQEATFFGFLAADRLGKPYSICSTQVAGDAGREQALLDNPGLARAFELFAVAMQKEARREWTQALAGADPLTLRLAADLAYRTGWYDRAVFVLSSGDALRLYEQRFPLARQDGVIQQAQEAGIEASWAYAIIRAESAWMTDAHSGADARGLMQLLPATAALVAKRSGVAWAGGDSLYDPPTNIVLGTRYLAQMAARYNGSPWLASAAYNAGPGRVDQWLAARGDLEPDLFVASIPFKETREYVARVMAFAVIYDWRINGDALSLDTRLSRIGANYALPGADAERKQVQCLAPPVTAPAPGSSTAAPPATPSSVVPSSVIPSKAVPSAAGSSGPAATNPGTRP
jgi:soluble lytic murein transglycosylase